MTYTTELNLTTVNRLIAHLEEMVDILVDAEELRVENKELLDELRIVESDAWDALPVPF